MRVVEIDLILKKTNRSEQGGILRDSKYTTAPAKAATIDTIRKRIHSNLEAWIRLPMSETGTTDWKMAQNRVRVVLAYSALLEARTSCSDLRCHGLRSLSYYSLFMSSYTENLLYSPWE
jgi:hypothetical protein